tara:strand:+ start:472 stop:621 length:150 start_codon:yes stop_codon:yes gene_type:complete
MKSKSKYLLNAEGKKYRSNTLVSLVWKVLTNKAEQPVKRKPRKTKMIKS